MEDIIQENNLRNELQGYVDHIIYRNGENGYTVLVFVSEEEEITCVGTFPAVSEGEYLALQGEFTSHPTYGEQFKVKTYQEKAPEDELSMERYLGSGAIKGIGIALAARIVRRFKKDTFRIIEEEPERLSEVKGISERMAMEISQQMMEKKDLRDAMIFLGNYGISTNLAVKIYNQYGLEVYSVIKENPYQMAEDVTGIGFKIADEIASRVGIHTDSDFRIRSGIIYELSQAAANGHTYLPMEELMQQCQMLLGVDVEDMEPHVMNLVMDKKLVVKGEQVYAQSIYHMEDMVAGMLEELDVIYDVPEIELNAAILRMEKEEQLSLDEKQANAVKMAATHGLFVLTGGPGTGKTTTIRGMIKYFEDEGYDIFLAAPTGRAAKRMSETTGYEAKTIHRLLEVNGGMGNTDEGVAEDHTKTKGKNVFERNERNPLETDVIIIDEMSMVDITLMYYLLKAVAHGTRLILVGDVNQLPSVGPGNVLRDIISSEQFPVVKLDKIFRQAAMSDIVVNAHKINAGEMVSIDNNSKDFFFLKRYNAEEITNAMLQLVKDKLPKYVEASSYDIQVLTPTRKGLLGVDNLNTILQQNLNPPSKGKLEKMVGDHIFREGDKVMQIKNNYQLEWEIKSKYGIPIDKGLGVFNGDTGILKEINEYTNTVIVEYEEGKTVEYPVKEMDELELAYAITIHKSQGSEYPAVVIPLLGGPRMLMNRNLLYTAVTRAKKCVMLVGDEHTFEEMIHNTSQLRRYSGLEDRIRERCSVN